jgi:hypothetical protein
MGGHLEVLKWARAKDCPWDEKTCAYAAKGGHLEVVKWARENGCPWSLLTCAAAAHVGFEQRAGEMRVKARTHAPAGKAAKRS